MHLWGCTGIMQYCSGPCHKGPKGAWPMGHAVLSVSGSTPGRSFPQPILNGGEADSTLAVDGPRKGNLAILP